MTIEEIPAAVRVIAGRAGMDEDEILALARDYRDVETNAMLDRELGLTVPETGRGVLLAAEADLKSRGINPDDATEQELAKALLRVAP